MLIFPRTLNGRFTWVLIVFLLFLISLTLYSHHSVQKSTSNSLEYIRKNQLLTEKINVLSTLLENIESKLYQYSAFLRRDLRDDILSLIERLESQSMAVLTEPDIQASKTLKTSSEQLVNETKNLKHIIKQYLAIMQNVNSRYPAMPLLLTYLEPSNQKFSEAVEQALQEGEYTEFNPKFIKRDQYRVIKLFQEARYAWAMQISWFRMFVANRMGAFGEPKTAMQNNLANRKLYATRVARILHRLEQYEQQGKLSIQQEASLEQMNDALHFYNQHLEQAVKIYSSKNWRADTSLQKESLQPALISYWQTLHSIKNAIANINKRGLSKSQDTAKLLSHFIWLFTGIISLMLLIVYNIFQRKIRSPVMQLADSMQTTNAELPSAEGNLEEVNRLIDAYRDMRYQVDNRQHRLQSILDNAAESIITIDSNGCMENFNKAAARLFLYQHDEVIGKQFSMLFPNNKSPAELHTTDNLIPDDNSSGPTNNAWEVIGQRKDGTQFYLSLKYSEMRIGGQTLYTAIVEDISERRAVMEHLRHLAEHDSLTGLYNRQYFNDEMERSFAQARRQQDYRCACIYIDLDNFKYVNDTLGHLEGDRLLVGISNTLKSRTRKSDILARLGGDEFALLLHNVDNHQAMLVAENFRQAISEFIFIADGKHIDAGCSIGVALYEIDIDNKDGLLARADIACHMAKRAGRNRVYLFEDADKSRINTFHEEMGWARRIRHALEYDDFTLATQPMLNVKDETIFSYELLLRMRDPESNQYLLPGSFLSAAERFGLMPEIDRWVIEHAFHWLSEQEEAVQGKLCYFINLSGKSIGDNNLLEFIKQLLPNLKISPQRIVFEITEDVAIAEMQQAKHFLHELRRLGFRTALDDFGVGYSSFSYLRELDVDFVKIDGSFINSMHTDELNLALVNAINKICHILGKQTIAEFVENDFALKLLKDIGVDYAQGYNITDESEFNAKANQIRFG